MHCNNAEHTFIPPIFFWVGFLFLENNVWGDKAISKKIGDTIDFLEKIKVICKII
jgi:hypothetical protein